MTDFTIAGGGSVYLLEPNTEAASAWISENLAPDVMWFGRGVAIEHRYVGPIIEGALADGLTVDGLQ